MIRPTPTWMIGVGGGKAALAASDLHAQAAGPTGSSSRQEPRFSTALTFVACGLSSSGRFFAELCSTVNISRTGCCLRLRTQPQRNSALVLREVPGGTALPEGISQLLFQLAWVQPVEGGWQIGAFALSNVDLFRLAPPNGAP